MSKITLFFGTVMAGLFIAMTLSGKITYLDTMDPAQNIFGKDNTAIKSEKIFKVEEKEPDELKILAFGDLMLGRYVRVLMDKYGKDYIFERLLKDDPDFLKGYDVVFANLEGPILGQGSKGGTSMIFSFNEDVAPFLKGYGFNLLSISNNHTLDKGVEGYENTIRVLQETGLGWCGDPSKASRESVFFGEKGDLKYAFVCLHDATIKLNKDETLTLINELEKEVDLTVISIHWGVEYVKVANEKIQGEFARAMVNAGADLIIGHHPHVVQNYEEYNGRMIFYSLGNFVFDQYWSEETQKGAALKINLSKEKDGKIKNDYELLPLKSVKSQPFLDTALPSAE